jgi:hypothetical protein
MLRSYRSIGCFLLGAIFMVLVSRGLDLYAFFTLALAVPWDKLADMTGQLAAQYIEWRKHRNQQADLRAA